MKIISVNHYPLDNSLNNWYELTDRLKEGDVRLALCGHGHSNRVLDFEGIPALMARSNLHAKDTVGGYNIIRFYGDTMLTAAVRMPGVMTLPSWTSMKIAMHDYSNDTTTYPRPDFSVNRKYPDVKELWRVQEKSDIGTGSVMAGRLLITTGTDGYIKALDIEIRSAEVAVCHRSQDIQHTVGRQQESDRCCHRRQGVCPEAQIREKDMELRLAAADGGITGHSR